MSGPSKDNVSCAASSLSALSIASLGSRLRAPGQGLEKKRKSRYLMAGSEPRTSLLDCSGALCKPRTGGTAIHYQLGMKGCWPGGRAGMAGDKKETLPVRRLIVRSRDLSIRLYLRCSMRPPRRWDLFVVMLAQVIERILKQNNFKWWTQSEPTSCSNDCSSGSMRMAETRREGETFEPWLWEEPHHQTPPHPVRSIVPGGLMRTADPREMGSVAGPQLQNKGWKKVFQGSWGD
ncbi:hypothetical protein BDK51DRAFT_29705 [Blyttiomyces helicus]|uniref:Uncharacterized protein n=1 Tax=Blyttiomyces helicus TaxID=388810 RepID=A0A4P9WM14_9FUNG|nr:hypothetical protein BDK51DRAFT_29705 [Blyttiomyces helicus]|eukprot:RKO94099.1 hypothetical protein BDK51DRAFT_29705 [Blyttiomyces helicus]